MAAVFLHLLLFRLGLGKHIRISMPAKARKPGIFEGAVAADLRKRGNLYSGRDHSGTREYPGDVYCRHGIGSRTGVCDRLRDGAAVPCAVLGLYRKISEY